MFPDSWAYCKAIAESDPSQRPHDYPQCSTGRYVWLEACFIPSVPLDLVHAPRFFIDDDDEGLDFGLIALNSNHVRLLEANGVVPIFENDSINQAEVAYHAYFMLGVPKDFTSGFCHNRVWRL